MSRWLHVLQNWLVSRTSVWVLATVSFIESSFFPIPADVLLIPMVFAKKDAWWRYAGITTIASVLGGVAGYALGFFVFEGFAESLVHFYDTKNYMATIANLFASATFVTMFITAFTPIPFKLFTILGGFFQVPFLPFILGSILGRGLRFYIEAYIVFLFGDKARIVLSRYVKHLRIVTILFVLGVVLYVMLKN
jgi:membrane protein YqaA with SNARE-associated domain